MSEKIYNIQKEKNIKRTFQKKLIKKDEIYDNNNKDFLSSIISGMDKIINS